MIMMGVFDIIMKRGALLKASFSSYGRALAVIPTIWNLDSLKICGAVSCLTRGGAEEATPPLSFLKDIFRKICQNF